MRCLLFCSLVPLLLLHGLLCPARGLAGTEALVITEFVAGNTAGLRDEDGDHSDWVEIHNREAGPVDLGGWSLTDTVTNPSRWRFPGTNLAGGGYLVVFASGKNRAVTGGELHTDFRLDSAGGYLGLVRADGSRASEYFYPAQRDNVAFGDSQQTTTQLLVNVGAEVRYRVPSEAGLGLSWNGSAEPFDDTAWRRGVIGLGYDTNGLSTGPFLQTIGEAAISRPLNDTAVGSIFVLATAGFSQVGELAEWVMFSTTTFPVTPMIVRLESSGSYTITGIGATRSSNGRGAQTNAFAVVSGSARVGPGSFLGWKDGSNGGNSTGVPAFTDGGAAGVRWFQQHTSFVTGENLGAGQFLARAYSLQGRVRGSLQNLIGTDVRGVMLGVNPSLYLRAPFTVPAGPSFDTLILRVAYDDGYVAWLNGVEVARRNAGPAATLAFDAVAATNRASLVAGEPEELDLSPFVALLHPGTNLLAMQGLNESAASGEFLIRPELMAAQTVSETNRFLPVPTPRGLNGAGAAGWVADTRFSPDRGFYAGPVEVTITSATPGVRIRFTTDGSVPSETNGTVYAGPVPVTGTTTLRAAAFVAGFIPTGVDTHTYLYPGQVAAQPALPAGFPAEWSGAPGDYEVDPNVTASTLPGYGLTNALLDLPSVSLVTTRADLFDPARGIYYNSGNSGPEWQRPASVEWIDPAGHGGFQVEASLRMGGDSSSGNGFTPKHSFRITFKAALGLGKLHFPLFPDTAVQDFDQIELRACSTDSWSVQEGYVDNGLVRWTPTRATYLRDQYTRDTLRDLGQPGSHGRYVHVYLNGLYWGVYNLVEWLNDAWSEEHLGGDKSEYDVVKDYAELEEGNLTAWNEMMALAAAGFPSEKEYQRLQGNNPDGTRNPAFPVYLNVANLIDYMLVHIYGGSEDWPGHNWWGSRRRGPLSEGFRFYAWDQEISNDSLQRTQVISAFGGTRFEAVNSPNCAAILYDRLRRNLSFQQRFIDRVQEVMLGDGPLTPLACSNRWMARQLEIDRAIVGESARWGDRRREPPFKRDTNWLGEMAWQQTYWGSNHVRAEQRFRSVGLYPALGAPLFAQPGGPVPAGFLLALANTNGSGSIYFTTDGSDPRLVTGEVSSSSQAYASPLLLAGPTWLRARVRSGTNWSAVVARRYFPAQDLSGLRFTEIMYHPPDEGLVDGDEYEFVELKNTSGSTLDLSGLVFTRGIQFTFTNGTSLGPGRFLVLARNGARFAERHPGVSPGGIYTGKLGNRGDIVALSYGGAAAGTPPLLSVSYGVLAPWPVAADGFGVSLALSEEAGAASADFSDARSWRASTQRGGSPGADDPAPILASIRVNEVRTHTLPPEVDAVELFNPTDGAVDVGGWFLTDDPGVPRKFRIPDGTTIPAGGFRVFLETEFNPTPGLLPSFGLGAAGDQVYLFSGDGATNLTGYSHGFAFGALAVGRTFGRHVISTGEEQFPEQREPTLGAVNAGPRVGPVVITEIHYHPDRDGDEFVELLNISGTNVALFNPLEPSLAWRCNGLGLVFPIGQVLGPGQFALLVATNPAAFAARYGLGPSVLVFGPFAGTLQDSGERLELQRPEVPTTNGIPYVTQEEVRYNDHAPWPAAADGSGASLQKREVAVYGNDPVAWEAAAPTPGRLLPAGRPPTVLVPPAGSTVVAGGAARFEVSGSSEAGSGTLRYQWRREEANLPGATRSVLELTNVQPADAGGYSVVLFNDVGAVQSTAGLLVVLRGATLVGSPQGVTLRGSTNNADYGSTTNGSAVLSVQAFSSSSLRFQWRFNGAPISPLLNPTAITPTLVMSNVTLAQDGAYDVEIRDDLGAVMSAPARVTVLLTPQFLVPPANQQVVQGGGFTASAVIRGNPPPFGYLWRQGSTNVYPPVASRETNSFFSRTNVQPVHAGAYRLILTNAATLAPVSSTFTVTLLPDADGDGLADPWETNYFGGLTAADPNADSDGDGVSNREEYLAGTDPLDPLSRLGLEVTRVSGVSGALLAFPAVSNRTYSIEYTDGGAVGVAGWRKLLEVAAQPQALRVEQVDRPAPTNRLYRVRTPRGQ